MSRSGLKLGVHVSISGALDQSVDRAVKRGCTTFQIFTRNPRGWKSKDLEGHIAEAFKTKLADSGISPVYAHMPYLPNLASPDEDVYAKSVEVLISEMKRCELLNIPYLVTHLGSHKGSGTTRGIQRLVEACRLALNASRGDVMLLLENTAGTKNSIGADLDDIASVMDGVGWDNRVRLCFDTCHAFAAGYELRSRSGLLETLKAVDQTVGLSRLELVHLNDSKGDLNSRLDRHEHVGLGRIGEGGFRGILGEKLIRSRPMVLETPIDRVRDDYGNLGRVREIAKRSGLGYRTQPRR
mgnify:CR=1 FL=1